MYEYYDYENKVLPDEKEKIEAKARARELKEAKEQKKEKRNKWFMCIVYALVFGI